MAKLTVLVVGASGYLGGRLADHFEKAGWDVRYGVSKTPGRTFPFTPVLADLTDKESLRNACDGVDFVVHAAGSGQVSAGKDESQVRHIDIDGTRQLLDAVEKQHVKKFLYVSTAHVYGDLVGNVTEKTPLRPTHAYGRLRVEVEEHINEFGGIIARLSNGFGAPLHEHIAQWGLVVNDLCRSAVSEKKMTLKSDGTQRRDFIPIRDVAAAVAHLLKTASGGTFNVGGEWVLSTKEVAEWIGERVKKQLGFRPELSVGKSTGEKPAAFTYSIEKLLATGFSPGRDRDGELDALIAFCASRFG